MSGARGQSEVVGVVLLLGFTLVVGGVTVALGAGAVSHASDRASVQQAESALSQFDSATSDVALGSSHAKRVDLGSANGNVRVTNAGTLTVTTTDLRGGATERRTFRLGAVVFSRGGETVAYQGGGVWRDGQVVSPPEIHYNNGTLTLPIVSVNGAGNAHGNGGLTVTRASPTRAVSLGANNPLSGARVNVTVQSPYYRGWATYLGSRTSGSVTVNDATNTTTMTLTNPLPPVRIDSGITSDGMGTTMMFNGNTNIDGYNSSVGPYSASKGLRTNITTVSPIDLTDGPIHANIITDNVVHVTWSTSLDGTIYTNSKVDYPNYYTPPPIVHGVTIPSFPSSVAGRVHSVASTAAKHNDDANASATTVTDANSTFTCTSTTPSCELDAGTYYVDGLSVNSGGRITLNTTGGDVNLVVDGSAKIGDNGWMTVTGPGRVNMYITGNTDVSSNGKVRTVNASTGTVTQRAPQFWLYTLPSSSVSVHDTGSFTGVAYGPGGSDRPGATIDVNSSGVVYGALVGNVVGINDTGTLHYDHALSSAYANPTGSKKETSTVSYLHVSVESVTVSDAR